MAARSPGPAAAASAPAAPAPLIRAVCEELTRTRTSTLRKARLHTRERNWAKGTATSARGRERATQERKFPSPIPGSMTTGTAPILNSANTEATSGRPGRTITRARSPRRTPPSASRERQASALRQYPMRLGPAQFEQTGMARRQAVLPHVTLQHTVSPQFVGVAEVLRLLAGTVQHPGDRIIRDPATLTQPRQFSQGCIDAD